MAKVKEYGTNYYLCGTSAADMYLTIYYSAISHQGLLFLSAGAGWCLYWHIRSGITGLYPVQWIPYWMPELGHRGRWKYKKEERS